MYTFSGLVDNSDAPVGERELPSDGYVPGYLHIEVNELGGMVFDAYVLADDEDDAVRRIEDRLNGVEITVMGDVYEE